MANREGNPNSATGGATGSAQSVPQKEVIELVKRINGNPQRIDRGLPPLEYDDQGWRIVFEKYLEDFALFKEGRTLIDMAICDLDFQGIYYWIPITNPPKGVTTPASRLMTLASGEGNE